MDGSVVHSDGFSKRWSKGNNKREAEREEIAKAELTRQKSEKGDRETGREGGRRGRDMAAAGRRR